MLHILKNIVILYRNQLNIIYIMKYKVIYKIGAMQKEFNAKTYEFAKLFKKDCEGYGYKAKIVKL